jgi:hypothetical protein
MLELRVAGYVKRSKTGIGVALKICKIRVVAYVKRSKITVVAVNPLKLGTTREIQRSESVLGTPYTDKLGVAREVHRGNVIAEAPQALNLRELLHTLQGRDVHSLAVDVAHRITLGRGQHTVAVRIVTSDYIAKICVREIAAVDRHITCSKDVDSA